MNSLSRFLLAGTGLLGLIVIADAAITNLPTTNYAGDQDGSSRYYGLLGLYGVAGDNEADVTSGHQLFVTSGVDPCNSTAKTTLPFSSSAGGPTSLVALSGSTKVYVCSITLFTDTAVKVSLIDGTGGACASAQHAIWGSTTAASGMSMPATGGFTQGSGGYTVGQTAAASALCLLQSGTSLIAGNLTYVQQ